MYTYVCVDVCMYYVFSWEVSKCFAACVISIFTGSSTLTCSCGYINHPSAIFCFFLSLQEAFTLIAI